MKIGAHVADALLAIFLELLLGAGHLDPTVDLLVHACRHLRLGDFDGVYLSLVQEKLLHGNLLGDGEVGVAAEVDALGKSLHSHLLDV